MRFSPEEGLGLGESLQYIPIHLKTAKMSHSRVSVKDDSFIKSASRLRAALDEYEAALEIDPTLVAIESGNSAPVNKPNLAILEGQIVEAADRVRSLVVNPHLEMLVFSLRVCYPAVNAD
jgi:hypothetical protein